MSDISLTLLCPVSLEEKLLDTLLMNTHVKLFTSLPIAAHGLSFGTLNTQEQVLGRAMATQVQVLLPLTAKETVLEALRQEFAGTGLRYWMVSVVETGVIQ